jgi:hypothetical protein
MGPEVWGCQTFFLGPFRASLGPGQRDTWVRAFLRYPCVASPAIVFAPLLLLFFLRIFVYCEVYALGACKFRSKRMLSEKCVHKRVCMFSN